uniref:Uncharacterized protein n=1 Tax=Octopus bimaculoides TaxID=37653 RepID=A0A0L8HVD7_OCTBM
MPTASAKIWLCLISIHYRRHLRICNNSFKKKIHFAPISSGKLRLHFLMSLQKYSLAIFLINKRGHVHISDINSFPKNTH